jgi:hypothetical protein
MVEEFDAVWCSIAHGLLGDTGFADPRSEQ